MLNSRIIIISIVIALTAISCGKNGIAGKTGDILELSAVIPEDSEDLDYSWSILNQPDASMLSSKNFSYINNGSVITFIPDAVGEYEVEVNIFQYGDNLSSQTFLIRVEKGEEVAQEVGGDQEGLVEEESDKKWFEDEEINIDEPKVLLTDSVYSQENIAINDIIIENKVEKITPPPPPIPPALPGSTIPKDLNRFTIQVASKKLLTDAKAVAAGLISDGFDAYIQKAYFKETDEVWFRIRVGSYDNRETAEEVAKSISEKRGISTWVDFVRFEE